MTNPLPRYYELLAEAFCAFEASDEFDVRSEIPESKAAWDRLNLQSRHAQMALVRYVLNTPSLMAAISET